LDFLKTIFLIIRTKLGIDGWPRWY